MPWSVDNTIPAMQNKSKELRKLFAEVANKSLSSGKDEQSAIFAGLAAVKLAERKNRPVKIEKTNDLPEHLRLVLHAKELIKSPEFEVNKAVDNISETTDVSITALQVKDNFLQVTYSDGTKKKLALPSQTVNTSSVIVGQGTPALVQYQYELSGLLQSITNETGRAFPRVVVYNADGDEVLVSNRLFNGSIIIESNIDMTGLFAVIE